MARKTRICPACGENRYLTSFKAMPPHLGGGRYKVCRKCMDKIRSIFDISK